MKLKTVLALLLFLCCVNVAAAAEYPYWIESTNAVWVPVNVSANENLTLYVEKLPGYSSNGPDVFEFFYTGEAAQWSGTYDHIGSDYIRLQNGQAVYSTSTFSDNVILEASARRTDSLSNSASDARVGFSKTGTPTQFTVFDMYRGASANELYHQSYVSSFTLNNRGTFTQGTWYPILLRLSEGTSALTLGGSTTSQTSQVPTGPYNVMLWTRPSYTETLEVKDIRVRQYTPNIPIVSIENRGGYYQINIENTGATSLTGYQIQIDATVLDITSSTESILVSDVPPYPEVSISLTSPAIGSYVADNTLGFTVSGLGNLSATVYVDSSAVWSGAVSEGLNQITPSLSQGPHSWYVVASATVGEDTVYNTSSTWTFTYDTIDPSPSSVVISPDADNIAVGTIVNTNIRWSDTNLDYAQFYVDYGSGFVLEDSLSFTSSLQWFNTSIDTTGYVGQTVAWKQVAYDDAGNSYTYSDSFAVVLNALNIYVYDEKTGTQILPSNVVVYNEDISQEAMISESTKVASLTYTNLTSGKYIVNVAAEGYYTRRAIMLVDVTSLSELNVYLPSTNETIIYDTFKLTDNTRMYEPTDIILRLDKPMPIGTETIFSSYFDFAGSTATYLVASDQYILYIITPTETYNYGWLTPDPDGQIDININRFTFETVEEWIQYAYNESDSGVSFSYTSAKDIESAYMVVNKNGVEDYNATAATTSGQFTYVITEEGIYTIEIEVLTTTGDRFVRNSVLQVGAGKTIDFFPDDYTLALKSVVVAFIIVVGMLASSSYRADLACMYGAAVYAFAVHQDWCIGNIYTVTIVGIIAVAAIVKFQRKHDRSA